jgi:hypothetical protein
MLQSASKWSIGLAGIALMAGAGPSTAPTNQPVSHDAATDWLLGAATSQPAIAPAASEPALESLPVSPLVSKEQNDPDQRHGTITLSDGTIISGVIATTAGKPLRTWDPQANDYRDMPMRLIKSIKAQVLWERDEPEWRFEESGSDIKINTGKTYPARETSYEITSADGKNVTGGIVAPLYLRDDRGEEKTYILHKRDKGNVGQTLKELVYVADVKFDDPK